MPWNRTTLLCWDAHLDTQRGRAVQVEATCYLASYCWWCGKTLTDSIPLLRFSTTSQVKMSRIDFHHQQYHSVKRSLHQVWDIPTRFVFRNTTFQQAWIIFTKSIETYQDRSIPTKTDPPHSLVNYNNCREIKHKHGTTTWLANKTKQNKQLSLFRSLTRGFFDLPKNKPAVCHYPGSQCIVFLLGFAFSMLGQT